MKKIFIPLLIVLMTYGIANAVGEGGIEGIPQAFGPLPGVICQSGTPVATTGTTNNITLATCTIPASSIGKNGSILIFSLWQYPNSSNTKNLFVQLGGINLATYAATATNSYISVQMLADSGTYQAQWTAPYTVGALSSNIANLSVNLAASQNITLVGNTSLATASPAANVVCNGTLCTVTVTTPAGNNFPTGTYIYGNGTNMSGANLACANTIGTSGNSTVQATYISATQFSFPWTNCANGTTNTGAVAAAGQFAPFSSLNLLQYSVTVFPSSP